LKKHSKLKVLVLGAAVLLQVMLPIGMVSATSTQVGATATFLSAITLTPTNMQFGKITFGATPASGDKVTLTTAGAISYAGTFAAGGSATIAAGDVAITASTGNTLVVECSTTGVLAQSAGAGRITVNTIKIADTASAAGGGSACAGIGTTATTFSYVTGTDDHVKLGGVIDGSTQVSFAAGSYSTSNTGGSAVNVNIYYQ
jgi:hypothetical protein